ncbi:MAG TPA: cytochrome c biogenesis protein CcdA [Bryobacteraceae bacterium]|nr:cytochrome c biogenesis protein CcdA [Bryobacteraceae bacterium]
MNAFRIAGLAACVSAVAVGQRLDPVQWSMTSSAEVAQAGATVPLRLTAKIEPGWHLYSLTIPKDLYPTKITLADNPAVESSKVYQPPPLRAMDPNLKQEVETYSNQAEFFIPATLTQDAQGPVEMTANIRYRVCDDKQCLNPRTKSASYKLTAAPFAPALAAFVVPAGYIEVKPGGLSDVATAVSTTPAAPPASQQGMAAFVLAAFGFGLAAIFTPCVFPMIPITVSFFLNQRGGLVQALVFSLGIVVLFCALGLGVTALAGPIGISRLGGNPWVNAFIALVFGIFALSLLGAFEITLPSALLTKLDGASRRGGTLGTLLMGLTFSLTSFACVGPFVGPLLASSVQAQGAQPVIGMAAFATGLASPFFFLAAFPSYLKKLPRSGGWLARVKIVMGFVLLAVMLKYLSTIDQVLGTNLLTRERFLAAWFVLFAMAGLYLLGLLRLEGIEADDKLGTGRLLSGGALLIFAFSLLPGMFGAPLGELDAYVPVATGGLGGSNAAAGGLQWMKNDYQAALDRGRQENKLVLVTFTGYACTNCHWMKANMFPRPEIAEIAKDLILVELYTDGSDASSEENARLEDTKFASVSTPLFVLLDGRENVLATSGYTRSTQEFLAFLKSRAKA